jgi:hypothetical protein
MRKKVIAAVGLVALVAVSVAAAAQVNTYSVTGSTNPTKAGSKKKPVPVALSFNYTVGEATGQRPSPIKHYKISFDGIVAHGDAFPKCTAAQINAKSPPSDSGCPKGSLVGSGNVENLAGATSDPTKKLSCHIDLKVYNAGAGAQALYLKGGPNPDLKKNCPVPTNQAIPTVLSKRGGTFSDEFDVPPNLLHPAGVGYDNAVVQVASSFPKKISSGKGKKASAAKGKKKQGKKVGYFESTGGCKGGKRKVSVEFTSEAGQVSTTVGSASCKK